MARTILLADDSVTIRKVVELTFGDTDIRVVSVGSGREALNRLEALAPDLVVADVVMPAPTGYDLCREIKASHRPVPVLLLAGTFEPFDEERARSCGADGHLVKPFESRALVERVHELLERREAPPAPSAIPPGSGATRTVTGGADSQRAPDDRSSGEEAGASTAAPPLRSEVRVAGTPGPADAAPLNDAQLDAVARAVVSKLSEHVLREIAWEVVPDLAEVIIRERIRELEREDEGGA
jgi:CheY-like chemotaxis protein